MLGSLVRRPRLPAPKHGGHLFANFSVGERYRTQTNRAVLTRLLRLIDSKQDIQHYLDQFHPSQGDSLAVIALGSNALSPSGCATRAQVEELADSLAFLRHVGLTPIVVHGELDLDHDRDNHSSPSFDDSSDQSGLLQRIRTTNHQVSALLEHRDAAARPISSGVFTAVDELHCGKFSNQGSVTDITPEGIESAIRSDFIPVVAALGTSSADSRTFVLDPHHAALHLARVLQPLRSIFIDTNNQASSWLPNPIGPDGLNELNNELGPNASIMLGTPTGLSSAIFPDPALLTVLRNPPSIQTATSLQQFPSQGVLREALQRHLHPSTGINIDTLMEQLETRDFIAYFDHDSNSSSPEQTIHNLALVFSRASFPWEVSLSSGDPDAQPSDDPPTTLVDESHLDESISELALFGMHQSDWHNGVAKDFWNRIRAEHESLWGWLTESHPSLPWWLSQTSGSLKRRPEGKVYLWHGVVT